MSRLAAAALALALTGCSPYVYESEINSFANSVDALRQARTAAIQATTAAAVEYDVARWSANNPDSLKLDKCDNIEVVRGCRLVSPNDADEREITDQRQKFANANLASASAYRAISAYVGGLRAVTNAADRAALDAETDRLVGGICSLSNNPLALAATSGTTAAVCGVAKLGGELFAISLDHRRFQALREAVHAANEPFKTLVPLLVKDLKRVLQVQLAEIDGEADTLIIALKTAKGDDHLNTLRRLFALEADVRRIGAIDLDKIEFGMLAAHAALITATDSDDRQIRAVSKALTDLADAAEPLIDTLQSVPFQTGARK